MSKDRCDVSGFTFVNNGRLFGYNSEGSPCAYSKPVTIAIKPTPLVATKPAKEFAHSSYDLSDRTSGSSKTMHIQPIYQPTLTSIPQQDFYADLAWTPSAPKVSYDSLGSQAFYDNQTYSYSLQTQKYAVKIKEFKELAAKQGVTPELRVSIEKEYVHFCASKVAFHASAVDFHLSQAAHAGKYIEELRELLAKNMASKQLRDSRVDDSRQGIPDALSSEVQEDLDSRGGSFCFPDNKAAYANAFSNEPILNYLVGIELHKTEYSRIGAGIQDTIDKATKVKIEAEQAAALSKDQEKLYLNKRIQYLEKIAQEEHARRVEELAKEVSVAEVVVESTPLAISHIPSPMKHDFEVMQTEYESMVSELCSDMAEKSKIAPTESYVSRFKRAEPLPMMSHEESFEKYPGSQITFDHAQLSAQAEAGNFELRGSRLSIGPDPRLELEKSLSNNVKPRLKSILASRLEEWSLQQAVTKSHFSHDNLESEELFASIFGIDNWSRIGVRGQVQEESPEEFSAIPFVSARRYEVDSIKMNPYLLQVDVTTIINLNLSNNNLGDDAAQIIGQALVGGQLPATRAINVSGNKITEVGERHLVGAMQSDAVQEIILLTYKLDENAKMMFGTKEEKIAIFRELLARGAEIGIDNENMVVDNSWLGKIKNTLKGLDVVGIGIFGFAKCKWNPDEIVESYAQGELIAKLPKSLGNFIGNVLNVKSTVSCYLGATEEAWLTEAGQYVIKHDLCVMGETEFCNEQ